MQHVAKPERATPTLAKDNGTSQNGAIQADRDGQDCYKGVGSGIPGAEIRERLVGYLLRPKAPGRWVSLPSEPPRCCCAPGMAPTLTPQDRHGMSDRLKRVGKP